MAKRVIDDNTLTGIAEAIREKAKTTDSLTPLQMPGAILDIKGAEVEEVTNSAGGKSVYINSEVPKLPEGYTRLQWIQSTGTQYVDTGFKPNQDTRVLIDLQGATTASGVYGMHYGVKQFMAGKASKSSWNYYVYYGSQEVNLGTRTAEDFTARHTIDHNKNVITTGGVTQTLSAETFSSSYNMYLFGANNDGSLGWAGTIKVFSCQIYDNGNMVRDYVPCLNASGVAGLYDFVNGVFYGDAAGGAFMAGPVVLEYELPEGYEELEYIQSGNGQYADTGFKHDNNTRIIADYEAFAGDVHAQIFGACGSSYAKSMMFLAYKDASKYLVYYNGTRTDFASDTSGRHTIDADKNTYTLDGGTVIASYTAATFQSDFNMYLFAFNNNGTAGNVGSTIRLYACQIYDNGTLVRYYVPCKNASGVVGLWDAVNNTFTGDAAGVGFIAGPRKHVVLPDGYTRLKWIESDGLQFIDTGYKSPSTNLRVVLKFQYTAAHSESSLFGSESSTSGSKYSICPYGDQPLFYVGSKTSISAGTTEIGKDYELDVTADGGTLHVSWNGTTYTASYTGTLNTSNNIYLFANNVSGVLSQLCEYRMYSCQIFGGGVLARDYIPTKDPSGVAGLYDTVTEAFYTEFVGFPFVAGPESGADEMGVSKVVLEDEVLIDLTGDTVTPEALLSGFTAHNAMGQLIRGAASAGKPVATGMFTPTSTTTSMVISGLDFKAKIVAVFKASAGVTSGVVMDALVDTETGIGVLDWAEYDYSYWLAVARRVWSAANVKIAATDTGFTFSVPTPFGAHPYYWYAIG